MALTSWTVEAVQCIVTEIVDKIVRDHVLRSYQMHVDKQALLKSAIFILLSASL